MKLSERLSLVRAGYTKKEIAELESAENFTEDQTEETEDQTEETEDQTEETEDQTEETEDPLLKKIGTLEDSLTKLTKAMQKENIMKSDQKLKEKDSVEDMLAKTFF